MNNKARRGVVSADPEMDELLQMASAEDLLKTPSTVAPIQRSPLNLTPPNLKQMQPKLLVEKNSFLIDAIEKLVVLIYLVCSISIIALIVWMAYVAATGVTEREIKNVIHSNRELRQDQPLKFQMAYSPKKMALMKSIPRYRELHRYRKKSKGSLEPQTPHSHSHPHHHHYYHTRKAKLNEAIS